MYKFGSTSTRRLKTCDERLQVILLEALEYIDIAVLQGYRGAAEQNQYYSEGKSKLQYPLSKHNQSPSLAVDVAPWPIDFTNISDKDRQRFAYMAGVIKSIGRAKGVTIRWGGDWDGDGELNDQTFDDLPHFEIVDD